MWIIHILYYDYDSYYRQYAYSIVKASEIQKLVLLLDANKTIKIAFITQRHYGSKCIRTRMPKSKKNDLVYNIGSFINHYRGRKKHTKWTGERGNCRTK